jgi:ATP/maltotriose-dependent transcriptional regulator MalT
VWLEEADALAAELGDGAALARVRVRRAEAALRRGELEAADRLLAEEGDAGEGDGPAAYRRAVARARTATRRRDFAAAAAALEQAAPLLPPDESRTAGLLFLARGELQLERADHSEARRTLRRAADALPPLLVEEQVQAAQSLAFLATAEMDSAAALRWVDGAREYLRGAGVWGEAAQMALVAGNLALSLGEAPRAEALFDEGLEALGRAPDPGMEALLEASRARLRSARGEHAAAVEPALRAADLFARTGNALGYASAVGTIANLRTQDGDYPEAYRTLAVGEAVARRLGLLQAAAAFREQIAALRERIMGAEAFDRMAAALAREMREGGGEPGSS